MKRSLNLVFWVDLTLLLVTKWCVDLLRDWLGISRRKIEWGLILVYCVGFGVYGICCHEKWDVLTSLAVSGMMWRHTQKPETYRMMVLLDFFAIVVRFIAFLCITTLVMTVLFAPPHRLRDIPFAASQFAYLAFLYVYVLPTDDGERGKKAKMAFSKLKELFGTSWVPQPVSVPR